MEIYFCETCRTRLSDAELAAGDAVRDGGEVYCKPCALRLGIYERAREESRRDVEYRDEAPARRRRPRSSRAAPAPAAPGGQAVLYGACAVGVAVITALVFVIAKKRGRERPLGRPVVRRLPPRPGPARPAVSERPSRPELRPESEPEPPPPVDAPVRPALSAKPPALPVSRPPPRPEPPAPPPAAPAVRPVAEGEISIFNGRDMKGWRRAGGKAWVEDGVLAAANDADLFYEADWTEFALSFEMKAGGGRRGQIALGVGLGHARQGRGKWRAVVMFHTDGDAHVGIKRKRVWRSGNGKFPIDRWTPVKLELTRAALRLSRGETHVGSVGLNTVPVQKGGIYFYANAGHTVRLRNIRVRVLSR